MVGNFELTRSSNIHVLSFEWSVAEPGENCLKEATDEDS